MATFHQKNLMAIVLILQDFNLLDANYIFFSSSNSVYSTSCSINEKGLVFSWNKNQCGIIT